MFNFHNKAPKNDSIFKVQFHNTNFALKMPKWATIMPKWATKMLELATCCQKSGVFIAKTIYFFQSTDIFFLSQCYYQIFDFNDV